MKTLIEQFPQNLSDALEIAKQNPLTKDYPTFENIVICGLGGSGIGGKFIQHWVENDIDIPIQICQGYELPKYVSKKSLVILSSYSGNTEETLEMGRIAKERQASILAVTSGGKLQEFCDEYNYEYNIVPGGQPPRTQLGFSIVQLIHFLTQLQLIPDTFLHDFSKAIKGIQNKQEEFKEAGEKIADFCHQKNIILYADDKNEAIIIRARQQFNENAKVLCNHHVIPEMNHNELVGWAGGSDDYAVLFVHTGNLHPQNIKRFNFSKERIQKITDNILEISIDNASQIERSLYLVHMLDWASYYLAALRKVDAIEVNVISNLKASLANS